MKKIHYILGGIALFVFPLGVHAQKQVKDSTVNRTVVVEQEYNPDILDASKINVLPKVEPPTVSKRTVEYDATLMPADDIPTTPMQAYTGKEVQARALPGYVRLGYGNYGNLDIRANYLFMLSNNDRINLNFHMDGRNGKLDLPDNGGDWKSHFYRSHANIDYRHSFKKVDLDVAGNFGLSNFNFLPGAAITKQKFTSGELHFGMKSTDQNLPLQFRAETNLMLYGRQYDFGTLDSKETVIRTKALVTGSLSEEQTIGIDFEMDNVFYKNNGFENYTSLNLNPHYRFENDDWKINLGAHVDLALNFGKGLRIAPDITAEYNFSDSYVLYMQAKGGKRQNDFRRLETFCPYGQTLLQPDATYEQMNAALGFKASPLTGLWFNLYGGYQNLKNDLLYNYSGLPDTSTGIEYKMLTFAQTHTNNVYAGTEISYDYKSILSLSARYTYHSWNSADNEYLLAIKPENEATVSIGIHPFAPLQLNIGFEYISHKEEATFSNMPDINNLRIGASYNLFKGVSAYVQMDNLLNKDYQYYWGYPAEGINFMGGVSFKF